MYYLKRLEVRSSKSASLGWQVLAGLVPCGGCEGQVWALPLFPSRCLASRRRGRLSAARGPLQAPCPLPPASRGRPQCLASGPSRTALSLAGSQLSCLALRFRSFLFRFRTAPGVGCARWWESRASAWRPCLCSDCSSASLETVTLLQALC